MPVARTSSPSPSPAAQGRGRGGGPFSVQNGPFSAGHVQLAATRSRLGEESASGPPRGVPSPPTLAVIQITSVGGPVTTRQHDASVYEQIQGEERFQELKRRFRSWAFPMTAAFLAWYLLYVVLSAWARDFMSTKVFGHINVALIFGLLQFVSTFLIAWAYSRYAEKKLDPVADEIRHEVEGKTE
ncbi:DUF485 domain-containing protein [Streptosporangium sp. NPDC087985]|uniref:DUF485 domain-containing protein n=1 Tax=Streptosporangium sp. NPDC087985 TaxID=3366196 RepID=UPI0037FBD8B9